MCLRLQTMHADSSLNTRLLLIGGGGVYGALPVGSNSKTSPKKSFTSHDFANIRTYLKENGQAIYDHTHYAVIGHGSS